MSSSKAKFAVALCLGALAGAALWWSGTGAKSAIGNLGAGMLAAGAFEVSVIGLGWLHGWWARRSVRAVFGPDAYSTDQNGERRLVLAYSTFTHMSRINTPQQPAMVHDHVAVDQIPFLNLLPRNNLGQAILPVFCVEEPVASHDIRGLVYIASSLQEAGAHFATHRSADVVGEVDKSLVTFGLGGGRRALQVIEQLARFGIQRRDANGDIVWKSTGESVAGAGNGKHLGYVICVRPDHHPRVRWLLCGGHTGLGTSASAYWLSANFASISGRTRKEAAKLQRTVFAKTRAYLWPKFSGWILVTACRPDAERSTEIKDCILLRE